MVHRASSRLPRYLIPIGGAHQQRLGLRRDTLHDFACWRDVADQVDRLARDHRRGVEVAGCARGVVAGRLFGLALEQLELATTPTLRKAVRKYAAGVGRGPDIAARDVEKDAADCRIA